MTINSDKFIQIVSKVGGQSEIETRQLILRSYTTSSIVPTKSILDFDSLSSVLNYFGDNSEEYKIAEYYFGFISKGASKPKKIQFARWADKATNAMAYSRVLKSTDISAIKKIDSGQFNIILNGSTKEVKGLNLTGTSSFASIATAVETKIKEVITTASFKFDSDLSKFILDTGSAGNGEISFSDISKDPCKALGLLDDTSIYSSGVKAESITDVLTESTEKNNNFGSYSFIKDLTKEQIAESGKWVDGENVQFIYLVAVFNSTYKDVQGLLKGYSSCCMTYCDNSDKNTTDYAYLLPACVMASQNFDKPNASENYMYQKDNRLTPSVSSDEMATELDSLKINYYGLTQDSGHYIAFYEEGALTGGNSGINYIGVHVNEQWLRSEIKATFLNMLLSMKQIPADNKGVSLASSFLDSVINKAILNGTFSQGVSLTDLQIATITDLTNDANAYHDVSSKGYWFKVTADRANRKLDYLLIYTKRDQINSIHGTHELI